MIKNINDLSISQYYEFEELLKNNDIFGIFDLFGIDSSELSIREMNNTFNEITKILPVKSKLEKYYYINGVKYKAILNLTKLKAGQFIDLQTYMSGSRKLEQILSIFLIPMKRKYGMWFEQKYGDYDVIAVQKEIFDNFRISDARALSDFFLTLSITLLQIMKDSSARKLMKKKKEKEKNKK